MPIPKTNSGKTSTREQKQILGKIRQGDYSWGKQEVKIGSTL